MVAFVNSSTSVLKATSPFLVSAKSKQVAQTNETVLSPVSLNTQAADVAYSFAPAANIALLSRPAASVLLAVQSGEKQPLPEKSLDTKQSNFSSTAQSYAQISNTAADNSKTSFAVNA